MAAAQWKEMRMMNAKCRTKINPSAIAKCLIIDQSRRS
jgi:hypothetical protein